MKAHIKPRFALLCLFASHVSFAQFGGQDIPEYKASNGITYKVGDRVKLGVGSANNGSFNYVTMRSVLLMDPNMSSRNNAHKSLAGKVATIDKIKSIKGGEQVYFVVTGLTAVRWALMIEEAITKCEIADCRKESDIIVAVPDKYDQIKKLKELLDDGAITEEEYEKEKKKVLGDDQ